MKKYIQVTLKNKQGNLVARDLPPKGSEANKNQEKKPLNFLFFPRIFFLEML